MKAPKTQSSNSSSVTRGKAPFFTKRENTESLGNDQVYLKEGDSDSFFGKTAQPEPFFTPSTIQPKLTIGQPDDKYEKEADAVADKVVQKLAEPSVQKAEKFDHHNQNTSAQPATRSNHPSLQLQSEQMPEEEGQEREETLQTKPIFESNGDPEENDIQRSSITVQRSGDGSPGVASSSLESRLNSSRSSGTPLPEDTRSSMESAFGSDFSGVRVHTGGDSVQMNQELGARAFTHGSDIHFNAGQYDHGSTEGQRLLAHELTHVVQQGNALSAKAVQRNPEINDQGEQLPEPENKLVEKNPTDNTVEEALPPKPDQGEEGENPLVTQIASDLSIDQPLTDGQKEQYKWDQALAEIKEANPGIGKSTAIRWTIKSLINGWRQGMRPVPDIRAVKVEIKEGTWHIKAYSYADAYRFAKEHDHHGYWFWIRAITEEKGSGIQQLGSVNRYNQKKFTFNGQLVDMLWWVAGIEAHRALRNKVMEAQSIGDEFNELIKYAQKQVFGEGESYPKGMLNAESLKRIRTRYKELGGKEKEFKNIEGNVYGYAWDSKGVNLRSSPHQKQVNEPSQDAENLLQNLPFGTTFKILAETVEEGEGWYQVELLDKKTTGYVAQYLVKRKAFEKSPNAFLYTVRNEDFDTKDEFRKDVKGRANAIKIARKFYKGRNTYDYLRIMLEFNEGNPGFSIPEGLDPSKAEDLNKIVVWEGFTIWLPTEDYLYQRVKKEKRSYLDIILDIDSMDDLDDAAREGFDKFKADSAQSQHEKEKQLSKEQGTFKKNIEKIEEIDPKYLQVIKEQTGVQWSTFFAAFLGFSGLAFNTVEYFRKNKIWQELNQTLQNTYGISADEVVNTILYFRNMALQDAMGLLSDARHFIFQEHKRLNNNEYLTGLFTFLQQLDKEYEKSDMLRAKAIYSFFKTRKISGESLDKILEFINLIFGDAIAKYGIDYMVIIQFYLNNKHDETELAKYLHHKDPNFAEAFISIFEFVISLGEDIFDPSISFTSGVIGKAMVAASKLYPQLIEAAQNDEAVNNMRLKKAEELEILKDPNLNWRDLARLKNKEALRTKINEYFVDKLKDLRTTRRFLVDDPNKIWELKPLLLVSMSNRSIMPESKFGQLILDKIEDVDRANTMISIALAVLAIGLAIAGFFTGGATWVGVAMIVGGVTVSTIDLIRELQIYQFHSAASNTGVGGIMNLSDRDPGVWGVVLAILGLVLDVVDLFKAAGKAFKAIDELSQLGTFAGKFDDMYEELVKRGLKLSKEELKTKLLQAYQESKRLVDEGVTDKVKILFENVGLKKVPQEMLLPYARLYEIDEQLVAGLIRALKGEEHVLMFLAKHINDVPDSPETIASIVKILQQTGKGDNFIKEIFKHITTIGRHNLDILPDVVKRLEQSGITDPDLISSIFRHRGLQKVLLAESDETLQGLWTNYKAYKQSLPSGQIEKPFYKFVEEQNLASFTKTAEQIKAELYEQALKEYNEASTEFSKAVSETLGAVLPLSDEVIQALVKKIKAALKLAKYKGGDLMAFINKLIREGLPGFGKLKTYEFDKILKALVESDPELVARQIVLAGFESKGAMVDSIVAILKQGDVDALKLKKIFENSKLHDSIGSIDLSNVLRILTDQKPGGYAKIIDQLADPNQASAASHLLRQVYDETSGTLGTLDNFAEAMKQYRKLGFTQKWQFEFFDQYGKQFPDLFNSFSKWDSTLQKAFVDDFGKNAGMLAKFEGELDLLRVWQEAKAVKTTGEIIEGSKNIYKATAEQLSAAIKRIADHRNTTGNLRGANYGYLEGIVNGNLVDNKLWRSGEALETEPQIFDAIDVIGGKGNAWLRNTDSEFKMLNDLASKLGGVAGEKFPDITGTLKVVSENPYCASCRGIIQQFNEMFPNIKLILIDGAKK